MIKPNNGNEFCVIGATDYIHVRIAGASNAKCGAGKPKRRGFIVSAIQRCTIAGANERIDANQYKLCERCAAHTHET